MDYQTHSDELETPLEEAESVFGSVCGIKVDKVDVIYRVTVTFQLTKLHGIKLNVTEIDKVIKRSYNLM